jgi:hypothetical protein
MKTETLVNIVIAAAVVVLGFLIWRQIRQIKAMEKEIETISARKAQVINVDSLRSAIEAQIMDSLKVVLKDQDNKIAASAKVITQTRRQNEALQKRLDNIVISMPDL